MAITQKCKPLAGGISLNYEVVGGTTAPTTFKKENTIWVNTDVEIGEHQFSYAEPTTRADGSSALHSGDVWIQTDIDKAPVSFNAIKKNKLMIYPYNKINQWNGSDWKNMAGALYQGSTATQVYSAEEVVYENGKFVGDYSSYTATVASSSNGSLTLNSDHMLIKCNNGGHCYVGFNKEFIAPSGYTKMCLTFIPVNTWNNSNTSMHLGENFSDKWANYAKCSQTTAGTPVTLTISLTTLADAFWWGVGSNWDTYISPEVKVTKIWFEE